MLFRGPKEKQEYMKLSWLFIFLGGGFGSLSRFYISNWFQTKYNSNFPIGTFISNFLACVVLGLAVNRLAKADHNEAIWYYFVSIGFCGAFSTFSTFTKENYELLLNGSYGILFLYLLLSVLTCLFGFYIGHSISL